MIRTQAKSDCTMRTICFWALIAIALFATGCDDKKTDTKAAGSATAAAKAAPSAKPSASAEAKKDDEADRHPYTRYRNRQ